MKLMVVKPMVYISPSSLQVYLLCQHKTYLTRLADHEWIEERQTKAAVIGIAFGAFVVDYIAQKKNIDSPHLNLIRMMGKIKPEKGVNKGECEKLARELATKYVKLKIFKERIMDASEIHLELPRYRMFNGIPIYGIPDIVADGLPWDLKCRATSSSPNKGYGYRTTIDGTEQPPYHTKMTLDEYQPSWAIQMTFYSWLYATSHEQIQYGIHEVNGTCVVEHRGKIDPTFVIQVREQLQSMWENVNELYADIEEPTPRKDMCEKWGSVCKAAPLCTAYMTSLGDPEMRKMM